MTRTADDYLTDIQAEIHNIKRFTQNVSFDQFKSDTLRLYACVRSLEIIGEAAKKTPDEYKKSRPKIPWKKMAAMRDVLIHGYFGIDPEIVWKTIQEDMPELERAIKMV